MTFGARRTGAESQTVLYLNRRERRRRQFILLLPPKREQNEPNVVYRFLTAATCWDHYTCWECRVVVILRPKHRKCRSFSTRIRPSCHAEMTHLLQRETIARKQKLEYTSLSLFFFDPQTKDPISTIFPYRPSSLSLLTPQHIEIKEASVS